MPTTARPPDWLVPERDRALTPNRYDAGHKFVLPVELLVVHYTAGRSFGGACRWLCDPVAKASAHFVVGDGLVAQLAPLSSRTWHAGSSSGSSKWRGVTPNARSIGIEIDNLGKLARLPGAVLQPASPSVAALYHVPADGRLVVAVSAVRDAYGKPFAGPAFEAADGSLWTPYPVGTVRSVFELVGRLVDAFPVLARADGRAGDLPRIVGHSDVDPTRKIDPGPAFPLDELLARYTGAA